LGLPLYIILTSDIKVTMKIKLIKPERQICMVERRELMAEGGRVLAARQRRKVDQKPRLEIYAYLGNLF